MDSTTGPLERQRRMGPPPKRLPPHQPPPNLTEQAAQQAAQPILRADTESAAQRDIRENLPRFASDGPSHKKADRAARQFTPLSPDEFLEKFGDAFEPALGVNSAQNHQKSLLSQVRIPLSEVPIRVEGGDKEANAICARLIDYVKQGVKELPLPDKLKDKGPLLIEDVVLHLAACNSKTKELIFQLAEAAIQTDDRKELTRLANLVHAFTQRREHTGSLFKKIELAALLEKLMEKLDANEMRYEKAPLVDFIETVNSEIEASLKQPSSEMILEDLKKSRAYFEKVTQTITLLENNQVQTEKLEQQYKGKELEKHLGPVRRSSDEIGATLQRLMMVMPSQIRLWQGAYTTALTDPQIRTAQYEKKGKRKGSLTELSEGQKAVCQELDAHRALLSLIPTEYYLLDISKLSPQDLYSEIHSGNAETFGKITWGEILLSVTDAKNREGFPAVINAMEYFNQIQRLLQNGILTAKHPHEQIRKLIQIAEIARVNGDAMMLFQITSTLDSSPIARYFKGDNENPIVLSSQEEEILAEIRELTKSDNQYENLKKYMENEEWKKTRHFVPYVGFLQTGLTFANDKNPNTLPVANSTQVELNTAKYLVFGDLHKRFLDYKSKAPVQSKAKPELLISAELARQKNDTVLYDLSRRRNPSKKGSAPGPLQESERYHLEE